MTFQRVAAVSGWCEPDGMKRLLLVPTVLRAGCVASGIMESQGVDSSRFDPAQRLSPTAVEQNATMKDTSVHVAPNLLRAGASRSQIATAFGAPTEPSNVRAQVQDVN